MHTRQRVAAHEWADPEAVSSLDRDDVSQAVDRPVDLDEPAIELPTPPEMERATGFPTVMVIAPVLVALVLYAILKSPYVLIFAVFGPVFGIANVIDQRIGRRRRYRKARAQFDRDRGAARDNVRAAHHRIRQRAERLHPDARAIITGQGRGGVDVRLGSSTRHSGLRTTGGDAALQAEAAELEHMPFLTEATRLLVSGESMALNAFVRAMIVQIWSGRVECDITVHGESLTPVHRQLVAHRIATGTTVGASCQIVFDADRLSVTEHPDAVHVHVRGDGSAVQTSPDGSCLRFWPDALSETEFGHWLPRLALAQNRARRDAARLPELVYLRDIMARGSAHPVPGGAESSPGPSLRADFLVGEQGCVDIDLVRDGAHSLVSGTTGSGKSELLISWITSLCSRYSSDELGVLGLDFKGGSTFARLQELPQCRGVVTDLDGAEAVRVAQSLTAEVRRREHVLRSASVRDIADLPAGTLSRLVVIIDEFQALVQSHPELLEIVVDLAARGRSLGIHLVLCSQRATGTFPDALLANCSVRLALRMEQQSDSMTMIGTAAAASLPRTPHGRALLRVGGGDPVAVHVARTDDDDVAALAKRLGRAQVTAAPLWHPPLANQLWLHELTPGGSRAPATASRIAFGRIDSPETQSQPLAALGMGEHLFVVGGRHSGKTTTLRTLRAAADAAGWRVVALRENSEVAWDLIDWLRTDSADRPLLVTIDDLDILEASFDDDYRTAWLTGLLTAARIAKQRQVTFAVSAGRTTGTLSRFQQLCSHTLMLSLASRNDWILQGGDSRHYASALPPGRGRLDGELVQIALSDNADDPLIAPNSRSWEITPGVCIIARRTAGLTSWCEKQQIAVQPVPAITQLRTMPVSSDVVVLGDVEQWVGAFGAAGHLGDTRPIIAIGVTPGEWRSLFRGDPMPPALSDPQTQGFIRFPDGHFERIILDTHGVPTRIVSSIVLPE